jgi:excisionase family DNA binding protein
MTIPKRFMSEKFMSVRETAEYLSVSQKTIYNALRQGKLPGVRIGGLWRIPLEVLKPRYHKPPKKENENETSS